MMTSILLAAFILLFATLAFFPAIVAESPQDR